MKGDDNLLSIYEKKEDAAFPNRKVGVIKFKDMRERATLEKVVKKNGDEVLKINNVHWGTNYSEKTNSSLPRNLLSQEVLST